MDVIIEECEGMLRIFILVMDVVKRLNVGFSRLNQCFPLLILLQIQLLFVDRGLTEKPNFLKLDFS